MTASTSSSISSEDVEICEVEPDKETSCSGMKRVESAVTEACTKSEKICGINLTTPAKKPKIQHKTTAANCSPSELDTLRTEFLQMQKQLLMERHGRFMQVLDTVERVAAELRRNDDNVDQRNVERLRQVTKEGQLTDLISETFSVMENGL